jgi:hypothetical protein
MDSLVYCSTYVPLLKSYLLALIEAIVRFIDWLARLHARRYAQGIFVTTGK